MKEKFFNAKEYIDAVIEKSDLFCPVHHNEKMNLFSKLDMSSGYIDHCVAYDLSYKCHYGCTFNCTSTEFISLPLRVDKE